MKVYKTTDGIYLNEADCVSNGQVCNGEMVDARGVLLDGDIRKFSHLLNIEMGELLINNNKTWTKTHLTDDMRESKDMKTLMEEGLEDMKQARTRALLELLS